MRPPGATHRDPAAAAALTRAAVVLALALPRAGAVFAAEARPLNAQAWEAFQARDFAAAEARAREAWTAAEAAGDAVPAGLAAANVAAALAIRGRFPEALEWSARAEARLAGPGAKAMRGRASAGRALIHYARGDRAAGDRELARASADVGAGDWRLDFLRTAVKLYTDLDLSTAYDDLVRLLKRTPGGEDRVLCLIALGWVESFFGGPARERFDEAVRLVGEGGDLEVGVIAARNRGVALMRARDLDAAASALQAALEAARAGADRRLQVIVLNDLSLLRVQRGEDAKAREDDVQAESLLAAIADDVRRGKVEDSVLLDFRQLAKMRYLHMAPMLCPLFRGLFEQMAVDPAGAR